MLSTWRSSTSALMATMVMISQRGTWNSTASTGRPMMSAMDATDDFLLTFSTTIHTTPRMAR